MKLTLISQITLIVALVSAYSISAEAAGDPRQAVFREQLRYSAAYGEGIVAALKGTGKPGASKLQPNRHDSTKSDEIYVESLPGVELSWLRPGSNPERQIRYSLTITKKEFDLPIYLRIGTSGKRDVLSLFGEPRERSASSFIYYSPSNVGADILTFHFIGETLSKMEWRWAID